MAQRPPLRPGAGTPRRQKNNGYLTGKSARVKARPLGSGTVGHDPARWAPHDRRRQRAKADLRQNGAEQWPDER